MNVIQALEDPNVFGKLRDSIWSGWRAFLCALFVLPMTPELLALFQQYTGCSTLPAQPLHESWLVCGRRAGKFLIPATISAFWAAFCDWRPFLARWHKEAAE